MLVLYSRRKLLIELMRFFYQYSYYGFDAKCMYGNGSISPSISIPMQWIVVVFRHGCIEGGTYSDTFWLGPPNPYPLSYCNRGYDGSQVQTRPRLDSNTVVDCRLFFNWIPSSPTPLSEVFATPKLMRTGSDK
mmetsp:Transcript_24131/g.52065  ORF Transcript_24131/g.52065 Transcript_24131/m.52065 type:complete len:133 (-) Transcript_24131:74-472(-)